MRLPVITLLLLALLPVASRAQVVGVVLDSGGRPIAAAAVELWAGDRRVAVHAAGEDGRFAFGAEEADQATGLLARHPGYRPLSVRLGPPGDELALRLEVMPIALEGVTSRAGPERPCPNRESSEARALWTAAAARYSRALDTLPAGSRFLWDERRVSSEREVGAVPPDELRGNAGAGTPALERSWFARVDRAGYAYRITGESGSSEFGAWYYPIAFMGPHLVSDAFGRLHTFSIVSRGSSQVVLGFCPRPGALPGKARVQGTLRISLRDGLLVEARYEFRTAAPDERAAGEIVYAPATAPDGRPLPVPATDLFWRRPPGGRTVYQRYREYVRWELGGEGTAPRTWTKPGPPAGP